MYAKPCFLNICNPIWYHTLPSQPHHCNNIHGFKQCTTQDFISRFGSIRCQPFSLIQIILCGRRANLCGTQKKGYEKSHAKCEYSVLTLIGNSPEGALQTANKTNKNGSKGEKKKKKTKPKWKTYHIDITHTYYPISEIESKRNVDWSDFSLFFVCTIFRGCQFQWERTQEEIISPVGATRIHRLPWKSSLLSCIIKHQIHISHAHYSNITHTWTTHTHTHYTQLSTFKWLHILLFICFIVLHSVDCIAYLFQYTIYKFNHHGAIPLPTKCYCVKMKYERTENPGKKCKIIIIIIKKMLQSLKLLITEKVQKKYL